jgi:hypothetical protein
MNQRLGHGGITSVACHFVVISLRTQLAAGATSVELALLSSEVLGILRAPESFESSVGLNYDLPSPVILGRK